MAEQLGRRLDARRSGVQALYVFGSTASATAGPGSDIDDLHHAGVLPAPGTEIGKCHNVAKAIGG